jgi:hypothetical protein
MALQNSHRFSKPTSLKMPALVRSQIIEMRHFGTAGDRPVAPAAASTSTVTSYFVNEGPRRTCFEKVSVCSTTHDSYHR